MIAYIIIGIILLILLLICCTRIGVIAAYDGKFTFQLRIGLFTIAPTKKKKAVPKKESTTEEEAPKSAKKKKTLPKPTFEELTDLLSVVFTALEKSKRKMCKHLRVDPFEWSITIGGKDPADVAKMYGYANAALWNIMPRAEELFNIPNPSVHLGMDYEAERTIIRGKIGISIRIGALLVIAFTLAMPVFKWYRRVKKAHRADNSQAKNEKEQSQKLTA